MPAAAGRGAHAAAAAHDSSAAHADQLRDRQSAISDEDAASVMPPADLDAELARREAEVAALRARALAAVQANLAAKERELRALQAEVGFRTESMTISEDLQAEGAATTCTARKSRGAARQLIPSPPTVHRPQVQRLRRVQAGTLELLSGRDAELQRLRQEMSAAERAHCARKRAVDGMRAAVAAAAAGDSSVVP